MPEAEYTDLRGELDAIYATQALARFLPDGVITYTNALYAQLLGYAPNELAGQHHRTLVAPAYGNSRDYGEFWDQLRAGMAQQGPMLRQRRNGEDIWLRASYTPVKDAAGHICKVVMFAADITAQYRKNHAFEGKINAISEVQAVVQFAPDGRLADANDIFLNLLGYQLEELTGQHHRMLLDEHYQRAASYSNLWQQLQAGQAVTDEFKLLKKSAQGEVWLQASFVPVKDSHGRVQSVLMYGTDSTVRKLVNADYQAQIEGINASQAVIQYTADGIITDANANFLKSLGYQLEDLKGQHHRIFIRKELQNAPAYLAQWPAHARGEALAGVFRHIGKGDRYLWLQANYVPIRDSSGKVVKVVEYCIDLTQQKETLDEISSLINAAKAGDLSKRARVANASGDNLKLRQEINAMLDSITMPLKEISHVMEQVAAYDLSQEIQGDYQGELKSLKDYVNTALAQLRESIAKAKDTASVVKNNAREISSGNNELSARTEQQAANLEETAATMNEMTATVQQNANNAKLANELATSARKAADSGHAVVGNAIKAMTEITGSSQKISNIIEVINSIAFQSNLLALNASVEAARAGDQGRGFAVVADEVRQLSGRSAAAAKEIKELINDSTRKVQEGSALVNKSGQVLEEISSAVKKVSDVVGEIMSASDEQAGGIASVNTAVQQMDDMTQQNSALVEEAAANSESLGKLSDELNNMMDAFKV